jgi:hypothetical protein
MERLSPAWPSLLTHLRTGGSAPYLDRCRAWSSIRSPRSYRVLGRRRVHPSATRHGGGNADSSDFPHHRRRHGRLSAPAADAERRRPSHRSGRISGQGRYLNAPVAELSQSARARCWTTTRFRRNRRKRFISAGSGVQQGRDSQTRLHLLSFGGQLARTDLEALLDGDRRKLQLLNGLTLARDNAIRRFPCPGRTRPAAWQQPAGRSKRAGRQGAVGVRRHDPRPPARPEDRRPPDPAAICCCPSKPGHSNPRWKFWPTT